MQQAIVDQTFDIKLVSHGIAESLFSLEIIEESPVFNGHFPGNPILPGVVMIEAVRVSLNRLFPQEFHLKTAQNIKFLAVLSPIEFAAVQLRILHSPVEEGLKIDVRIFYGDKIFFKMKGVYRPI